LSAAFIVLVALSDEFHQSFEVSRTASFLDVCIDSGGGFAAVCVSTIRQYRRGQRIAG
jgi:VanZ family protein